MSSVTATLSRTADSLAGAAREVRGAWGIGQSALAAALAGAAFVPLFVGDPLALEGLATTLYLALAAVGLAVSVGLAGLPVLAQGAFVAVGAVSASLVRVHEDWPPLAAALLGAVVAAAAGALVAAGLARLRPAFVAVGTWIVAWLVYRALVEFPDLSGGAEGLVVPAGEVAGVELTPAVHYELALFLVGIAALGFAALARGYAGTALAAVRQRPAAASSLGVPSFRLRLGALTVSAAAAGLAGGLSVQLAGVSDPADYTPLLSFTLFLAVLLGGARTASGAVAGALAVAVVFWAADRLADFSGLAAGRLDALFAGVLLLGVLAIDSEGLLPELARRLRPRQKAARLLAAPVPTGPAAPPLRAAGLVKQFGGAVAVQNLDLVLEAGSITALVGPNGSGKTTALRLLAGTLDPDEGRVWLGGDELNPGQRARARRGVVRTLQATSVFPELTAIDNVLVGAGLHARHGGLLRTLLATPNARRELAERRAIALGALAEVGLETSASRYAAELTAGEQRRLMLAAALATEPLVLLVDEPSAGAAAQDLERLAAFLAGQRERGLALLVVEHNLRLVRRVADRVIVMDAGRVIASGTADEVAADPAVREAYLGRRGL